MNTIVIGFDGSETAKRALDRAAEIGEALSARLVVVSISSSGRGPVAEPVMVPQPALVPSPVGMMPTPGAPPEGSRQDTPAPEELAERQLEDARQTLAPRRLEVEYLTEVGPAAERLLEIADERDADLVVVGSREHGLVERLLARSVDEQVVRHCERDVLLVH